MSNFDFLVGDWPDLHEAAAKAESLANTDARTSCFQARRALELAVAWLYRHDTSLRQPYQDHLAALIHEPTFRQLVGDPVFTKIRLVKDLGNNAVHSHRAVPTTASTAAVRELFHVCFWLARIYARGVKPLDDLAFDPVLMPTSSPIPAQTLAQLRTLAEQVEARDRALAEARAGRAALDDELQQIRAEIAQVKAANSSRPDTHDYSESETRDLYIDLLLREAGWALDQPRDKEFPVTGMPTPGGAGNVDYVLWGDDGRPLGLVEAKRTRRDARVGQQQARLYADCLEAQFGRRPIVFYSNGYEHWLWDEANYPARPVQGFLTKDELELAVQRRASRQTLADFTIDPAIVERHYQIRAIRHIAEAFERDHDRKALLVMATGAGKTRTVVALSDLLMRAGWVKRVLFLADRRALVKQAVDTFKRHLPSSTPVNLVTERYTESRVYISTYPTMLGLIDEMHDGQRLFGIGHFDLVVIDEAHRSVYQKYRAIFDYFDSFLVGLTATPVDEIDRNTYSLFDLESGVPTDAYSLTDAVRDGFLVPVQSVSVPLKFVREGIRYDDLSEGEKDDWDALEWDETGDKPESVASAAINKWLFNADTVDKVLAHLMTRGQRVAGGDRLGKTIIFAKNNDHAEYIAARFNLNYPHFKGEFARVITFKTEHSETLIDTFKVPGKAPHIAISVDMLDTGIDVPEVVNLVFFKLVRSKTKFWQMMGRGTRLCPGLFGPGLDKEFFYVFDYCGNLEYFSQEPPTVAGSAGASLGKQLFTSRVELITEIDRLAAPQLASGMVETSVKYSDRVTERSLRADVADLLRSQVTAMNSNNFIVRPRRALVEKYGHPDAWVTLKPENVDELTHQVAELPSELVDEDEDAKRFDLLILRLQLALLRSDSGFERMRDQVRAIAGLLDEKSNIPMVRDQLELIQDVQSDVWWENVTAPMLERVRRRLRLLIKLIEKARRLPVYTNFEDEMGAEATVELPGFGAGAEFERFRSKARRFLLEHEDHVTIHKLRWNHPLTPSDISELERILIEAAVGTQADLERAKQENHGLGLFIRSLVGLDREAAKQAFNHLLSEQTPTANQIEFINLIVDHLTANGVMDPGRLYESPFTDIHDRGPDALFPSEEVDGLVAVLKEITQSAMTG